MSCVPFQLQDSGSSARFTDTTLVVNLVDVLDPPPAFSLREYTVQVSEGMYTDVSLHTQRETVAFLSGCRSQYSCYHHL